MKGAVHFENEIMPSDGTLTVVEIVLHCRNRPVFDFMIKKEETVFGPSDILSGGVNSWIEFASSWSRGFRNLPNPRVRAASPSACPLFVAWARGELGPASVVFPRWLDSA